MWRDDANTMRTAPPPRSHSTWNEGDYGRAVTRMMFTPKKESCLRGVSSFPAFGLSISNSARLVGSFIDSEKLKFRDKALPDRLVLTSLLCDSVVVIYALIFSFWFRFRTPMS